MKKPRENKIRWPVTCSECGTGKIAPTTAPGRRMNYKNMIGLPIPDELEIPTCGQCGVEWIDSTTARNLDEALETVYRERLNRLATIRLQQLADLDVTQTKLEQLLGLSQGYLSKIRAGARDPSPMLVSLLLLLASDPEARLRELEDSFERAA